MMRIISIIDKKFVIFLIVYFFCKIEQSLQLLIYQVSNRVNDLYNNYSNKKPHETNAMNKAMTWY